MSRRESRVGIGEDRRHRGGAVGRGIAPTALSIRTVYPSRRELRAVIEMLDEAELVTNLVVIIEKPFGTDLPSAVELNDYLHQTFQERQILRIDHFLGKEAARNILAFRFAHGLFEPIWNRNFIDHVQIDIPETLGLVQCANFYESTGAFKDMAVSHLI